MSPKRVNIENLRHIQEYDPHMNWGVTIMTSPLAFIDFVKAVTKDRRPDFKEINGATIYMTEDFKELWYYFGGKYGEPLENLNKHVKKLYKARKTFRLAFSYTREVEKETLWGKKYIDKVTMTGPFFICYNANVIS